MKRGGRDIDMCVCGGGGRSRGFMSSTENNIKRGGGKVNRCGLHSRRSMRNTKKEGRWRES